MDFVRKMKEDEEEEEKEEEEAETEAEEARLVWLDFIMDLLRK